MENERQNHFFRFEDLRIYDKSIDYYRWVNDIVSYFPKNGDGQGLSEPFVKAAQNIPLYIAEGSGRSKSQFVHYLKLAKGSARECVVFTTLAKKAGFIDDTTEENSRNHLIEITKMVGALISSIQRSTKGTSGSSSNSDSDDDDSDDE